jgi:CRP/FNR family cyclic AMP-dependent transcriptional regulator
MAPARSFLDDLPDDERRRLLAEARRRKFAKNEVVFHEGDPGDAVHLIIKGHVAIRATTPLGDVATFTVLGAGEAFGEQALLSGDNVRTASAVALEPTDTHAINRERFEHVRQTHPQVDRLLVQVLAAQVRRLSTHLTEALYVPVETRVLRRLVALGESYANGNDEGDGDGDDGTLIPLTQDDIATMAGTTRPTANRVLKGLEDDGIITMGRGRLTIVDAATLAHRAR